MSQADIDDRELVRRCLAGDAEAVRVLVECFQGSVLRLCWRMVRHQQDAEDITQEVLVRVVRSLRSWDAVRPLRPWVLAIAANRCRTHLAKSARQLAPIEQIADVADERPLDHDRDLAAELDIALAKLRPNYRMVVVMFHEQEMDVGEISRAIGRPVGTVKTWLHRARTELARQLARQPGMRGLCPRSGVTKS
jgi:RNA polymerase sigma-70 factor (ECF subfamily)